MQQHQRWLIGVGVLLGLLAICATCAYVAGFWPFEDLPIRDWPKRLERVRNAGIVIGGVVALMLAGWRGIAADRQSKEAGRQVDATQMGQRSDRFQRNLELLGHSSAAIRLGAIYALQRLASDDPNVYYLQIVRLLCAFARGPESASQEQSIVRPIDSVNLNSSADDSSKAIIEWLGRSRRHDLESDNNNEYTIDLRGANFSGIRLTGIYDFSEVDFTGANLSGAVLVSVNLSDSNFARANLESANFAGSDLTGASLDDAILTRTKFTNPLAIGLTQSQIDAARAGNAEPPEIIGLKDPQTSEPLQWRR